MPVVESKTPAQIKKGPLAQQYKNTGKAISLLDDAVVQAIEVLVAGLSDDDKYYRFNCACTILKKVVPDKKRKEISGPNGNPIDIDIVDKRQAVNSVVSILDEISIDELKAKASDGSFRLLEPDTGTKTEKTCPVEGEESTDSSRRRSRRDKS